MGDKGQESLRRFHPRAVLEGSQGRASGLGGSRLRRAVPAGLVDAGMASLASFAVTVQAARSFTPAELGTYAIFYTAFIMTAVVPTHLLFSPARSARSHMQSHAASGCWTNHCATACSWRWGRP
jgi:hypothetical protein